MLQFGTAATVMHTHCCRKKFKGADDGCTELYGIINHKNPCFYLYCATLFCIHGSTLRLLDRLALRTHHKQNIHVIMVIKPFALSLSKGERGLYA